MKKWQVLADQQSYPQKDLNLSVWVTRQKYAYLGYLCGTNTKCRRLLRSPSFAHSIQINFIHRWNLVRLFSLRAHKLIASRSDLARITEL